MMRETILTYLENALEKKLGEEYDFSIDFLPNQQIIQVGFRLFGENKEKISLEDAKHQESHEEFIEFQDFAYFYEEGKVNPEVLDGFAYIPFDRKKGIQTGVIDAFTESFYETAERGQEDLLDFLLAVDLLQKIENKTDEEIKNLFSELSAQHQDILIQSLEKVPKFELYWNKESFQKRIEQSLATERGQVFLPYPKY